MMQSSLSHLRNQVHGLFYSTTFYVSPARDWLLIALPIVGLFWKKAKDLKIIKTDKPKPKPDYSKPIVFGSKEIDHYLEIDWTKEEGWAAPVIKPFKHFRISPTNQAINYGVSCFEGHKAYRNEKDEVYLFRVDKNMARFASSFKRLCMPVKIL
jgi:hypothetical protein